MKILKIRGSNLASLYGKFELDFTTSPLLGCGLFTITGETGAGKSTLLDAMCLALYGRYPRITGEGPKDKIENSAGESLQTSDPRSILRTGSSDAYAEVDLMIGDKQLRASWRVRRAYGNVRGNLLDFERSLIDLDDGSILASGKKRVDEEITKQLRLTYEQFGRTVLLAQNEFDAFLRANDGQRADLLEKITGTELYSRISARAFDTEREALRALEELQQKTGVIPVLPDEQRRELLENIKSTEQSDQKHKEQALETQRSLDWTKRQDEAIVRIAKAKEQVVIADRELADNAPQKNLLEKLEIVAGIQDVLDQVERADAKLKSLSGEKENRILEQKKLHLALDAASKQLIKFKLQFSKTSKNIKQAAPLFEQALKLDTQISSTQQSQAEREKSQEGLKKNLAELHEQRSQHDITTGQKRERIATLERLIENDAALEAVSARKNELPQLFQRLSQANGDLGNKKSVYEQAGSKLKNLRQEIEASTEASKLGREKLASAQQRHDEKVIILNEMASDKVRLKRDHQSEFQTALSRLHAHLILLVGQSTRIEKAKEKRAEAEKTGLRASSEIAQFETRLKDLKGRLSETGDLVSRSLSILSKSALKLRASLQPDEVCPVCGSIDHPGHDDAATSEVLELMRNRTRELETEIAQQQGAHDKARGQLQKANISMESADEFLQSARQKLADLETQTNSLNERANTAAGFLNVPMKKPGDPQKQRTQIRKVEDELEQQIIDVQNKLIVVQRLEGEIKTGGEQLSDQEMWVKGQVEERQKLEQAEHRAVETVREIKHKQERLIERQDSILEQISTLLGDVDLSREDLQRDPRSAEEFLKREIERFDRHRAELQEIAKDLVTREKDIAIFDEKNQSTKGARRGGRKRSDEDRRAIVDAPTTTRQIV